MSQINYISIQDNPMENPLFITIVTFIFPQFVMAILLWAFAPKLSQLITNDNRKLQSQNTDLITVGSSLIGLYLFTKFLGLTIGSYIQHSEIYWPSLIPALFGLIIALGFNVIVQFYRKVKYFGLSQKR